jgi:cell division protein ZapA
MAKAEIEVWGKRYGVGCAPGDEPVLIALGQRLDARVREIAASAGDLGTERLLMAAALSFLDELSNAEQAGLALARLEGELARLAGRAEQLAAKAAPE